MEQFTEWAIDVIETLFQRWGYWVVFLGTLLENTLFLGLFVPGVVVLLLAGISAYGSGAAIDLRLVILSAFLGTSLGDTISYLAGRFGWRRALRRAEQLPFMDTVRRTLMRRTGLFVLAYHFMGYTRVVGPVTAGATRIPFRRWWLLDALGALLWVTVYTVAGYIAASLGMNFDTARRHAGTVDRTLLVAGVATVAVIVLLRLRARRRYAARLAEPAVTDEEPSRTPLR